MKILDVFVHPSDLWVTPHFTSRLSRVFGSVASSLSCLPALLQCTKSPEAIRTDSIISVSLVNNCSLEYDCTVIIIERIFFLMFFCGFLLPVGDHLVSITVTLANC